MQNQVHITPALDVDRVRRDFPILDREVRGHRLVYLDNAATTQKPLAVIQAVDEYYRQYNANVHRGVHYLSEQATLKYEGTRDRVRAFINAASEKEIIFTRGTTEGINLVAQSYARTFLNEGDEILVTTMEHHSNIVPWQMVCAQTGAVLRVAPMTDDGELILDELLALLNERTKVVAVTHMSNALGTINPVRPVIEGAHAVGAVVLIDGAQSISHLPIDVRELDVDFFAFSGHKIYAPTGIGVLYGRRELLESMPPWQGGGDMIRSVTFEKTTYNDLPWKFEAGTPDISGVIGLAAALDYVQSIGIEAIAAHEALLLERATSALSAIPGTRLIGAAPDKASVLSFVLESAHPHDIGTILDSLGVAIRTGHHCAEPVMRRLGVPATARASFSFYNTLDEIDSLVAGIEKVNQLFG